MTEVDGLFFRVVPEKIRHRLSPVLRVWQRPYVLRLLKKRRVEVFAENS